MIDSTSNTAISQEEAIEEAKRVIDENPYYGDVSPTGEPKRFQASQR